MSEHTKRSMLYKSLSVIGKSFAFILSFLLVLAVALLAMMKIICTGSVYARNTFVTTVLETGQMKFLASLVLSDDEIQEVVNTNSMQTVDLNVNEGLINIDGSSDGTKVDSGYSYQSDIEVIEFGGLTYKATLMIIKDPSRVSLATIKKSDGTWPELGLTLEQIVKNENAVAGINGGLYHSTNNSGGYPYGVVVSNGKIVRNKPQEFSGLVLVGITQNNILQIVDLSKMNATQSEQMVKDLGIRDAVCFQENVSKDNNHFVSLVINGTPREISGRGSGLNPRTAIGQRSDGSILLLVTDGRGSNSHAGASAADLIEIMTHYGAVNAANLDGGSSTCMYYNGGYLQNSVTFYYNQSSWRLPYAFIVK